MAAFLVGICPNEIYVAGATKTRGLGEGCFPLSIANYFTISTRTVVADECSWLVSGSFI